MRFYAEPKEKVVTFLKSSEEGLSSKEAKERLERFGPNLMEKKKKATLPSIFLNQFKDSLVILLIFAAILSFVTIHMENGEGGFEEYLEPIAIVAIILTTAILGTVQEYKAEKAMEALEKMSSPYARVIRDGKEMEVPAKSLVPGDIVILEEGDIVPADLRLLDERSLQADEASLTGESVPSKKITEAKKANTAVSDQENMAFMNTIVTYGKGKGIVTATGMSTEMGKIAKSLQSTKEVETPLQKKFAKMAKAIGAIVIFLIAIVFVVGVLKGEASLNKMFIFALSLAVAAVPNSLPVIVTVGLSMGSKRLAKKNMLIKKLPAAESLGSVTVICSDKTGTLTKNEMTAIKAYFNNNEIDITGTGYNPHGEFYIGKEQINPRQDIELLLRIGDLCNNANLEEEDGEYKILGDPTEGSLKVLARKGDIEKRYIKDNYAFIEELPFDADRKMMSVIYKNKFNNKTEAYVKGAPDILLQKCTKIFIDGQIRDITDEDRRNITKTNKSFAKDALRVLGTAYKDVTGWEDFNIEGVEKELVFVGLVGMIDPPRDEVKDAVAECNKAGIKVMVITGDHPDTARAVGKKIGLFKRGDMVITGKDIDYMSDKELEEKIEDIRIIARALPIQKSRVVDALKKNGHVVAMTGDGVNDAPALKKADIGISMGITGTDVAKEVSKATLVDDNFATIVNAINEGRNIYDKMIKSVRYLLSCNAGEIVSVLVAIMLNFPLPMIPLQILLMNMLTDNFPALGLGVEPSDDSVMSRPPRDPEAAPISKRMLLMIVIFGIIMGAGTFYMFYQYEGQGIDKARTVAFTTLVMFEMFAVISSRSLKPSLKSLNPLTNMWLLGGITLSLLIQVAVIYYAPLQLVFETAPLTLMDWVKITGISFLGFIMMEIGKVFGKSSVFHSKHDHHGGISR